MSRRYSRSEAQAILEHYTVKALGGYARAALAPPHTVARAIKAAERRLNRAARRALGARGDGRYHPLATTRVVVRSRNAR